MGSVQSADSECIAFCRGSICARVAFPRCWAEASGMFHDVAATGAEIMTDGPGQSIGNNWLFELLHCISYSTPRTSMNIS